MNKSYTLLLLIYIFIFSSCTRYQYISLSSHLNQNETKEFFNENDTVLIKYSFSGENFPLTITVYNKLSVPLYTDFGRSPVYINDYQINNSFGQYEQSGFIAPLSHSTFTSDPLSDKQLPFTHHDSTATYTGSNNLGLIHSYSEQSSPVYIRSILALSTNEDLTKPLFYDYSFWVSDVLQTYNKPALMTYNPANMFFIKKETGFGKFLSWTGIIILLLVTGALSAGT